MQVPDLLAGWADAAPQFEEIIAAAQIWPAVIDLASHEQDIRGAIGRPGARDTDAVRLCAASVLSRLRAPVPLRVVTEDGEFASDPGSAGRDGAGPGDGAE